MSSFFFFNDTATTEIYTLSLHDALPIYVRKRIVRQDVLLIGRVNLDVRICIQCEVPHVSHNSHDCWPGRCCCRVCKCYVLTKRVFTWEKPSREALTNNDDGRR